MVCRGRGQAPLRLAQSATATFDTDIVANVFNGTMTVAESVEDAYKKAVEIFQEFGAPGEIV